MILSKTSRYERWFRKLRDATAKAEIAMYFFGIELGEPIGGDFSYLGDKVIEVRFDKCQGIRVYLTQDGNEIALLLLGGDKSTQQRDIRDAKKMAREWHKERSRHGHK